LLKEFGPTVLVSCWSTPPLPDDVIVAGGHPLKYLCHAAGTVRNKISRDFIKSGRLVTNWGNSISHNVAEHALLLTLATLRNLPQWRPAITVNKGSWGDSHQLQTTSLRGKRVGIHGFGNVARELVRILGPFDVECRAYSHNVPPELMVEAGVIPCDSLAELFSESDIVIDCEALTPASTRSVTEKILRLLPERGVYVNVARGAIADEAAIARLTAEGRIRAALDVFSTEPLPDDSELLQIENLLLSPHIAGPTGDWLHYCGDFALNNLERYLKGQPLSGVVTLEAYDRTT
jgi:phosphoglycerate dehydrogenase-like enzyme